MSRVIYDGVPVPDEPKASVTAVEFLAQAKAERAARYTYEKIPGACFYKDDHAMIAASIPIEHEERPSKPRISKFVECLYFVPPLAIISAILFLLIGGQPAWEMIFPPSAQVVARRQWKKEFKDLPRLFQQKTAEISKATEKAEDAVRAAQEAVWEAEEGPAEQMSAAMTIARQAEITAEARLARLKAWEQQVWHQLERDLEQKYPHDYIFGEAK
jgi:hypothetical protein